ncbi:MAG: hypothetical protein AAF202_10065 [Pseudomonadota bacterium]
MRVLAMVFLMSLLSVQAQSESLRYFKLKVTMNMQDRPEMYREFVVHEKQTSRINMADEGEPKVIIEVVPEGIGAKAKAVRMNCKVEAEMEDGTFKVLGHPKFTTKARRPASITAQSRGLPQFSLQVSIGEEVKPAFVETPDKDALSHRAGESKEKN